jgi:hypothetical protein
MAKDSKILFGIVAVTLLLIFAGVFLLGKNTAQVAGTVSAGPLNIEASPSFYDLGEVPINGGIVTKEYEIKNTFGKSITLKKISTSCMCTKASVEVEDKKTKFFGMEGHGDANPPVNIEIGEGKTAKVVVRFDPAAHGPQGVGSFDRVVWLNFSEGVKELTFSGTVTSQ